MSLAEVPAPQSEATSPWLTRPRALLVACLALRHLHRAPPTSALDAEGALALMALHEHAVELPPKVAALLEESQDSPEAGTVSRLRATFGLSPAEVDLLLLVAAAQVDLAIARTMALLQGSTSPSLPSVGLLQELIRSTHPGSAAHRLLEAHGALARPGLLEVLQPLPGTPRSAAKVTAPPDVVDFLLGPSSPPANADPPSIRCRLVAPTADGLDRAHELAGALATVLHADAPLLGALRQARVQGRVPIVRVPASLTEEERTQANDALARLPGPLVLLETSGDCSLGGADPLHTERVEPCSPATRRAQWTEALSAQGWARDHAEALAARWPLLGHTSITLATRQASSVEDLPRALRSQHAASLRGLATLRIPARTWSDLVLPDATLHELHELVRWPRLRAQAAAQWPHAPLGPAGLKLLLAGPPGTGKSLTAEVLAGSLGLDLLIVDLAGMMSRWVGETSKHLRTLFEAASQGTSLLLFDEGDALFGRRGAQAEGNERYANQEVADLLQRLEAYRGAAVVTTNLLDAIDPAFQRRFTSVIELPSPGHVEQAKLWALALPGPREDEVQPAALGQWVRLAPAGILAAGAWATAQALDRHAPVSLMDIAEAVATQLRKGGQPLTLATLGPLLHRLAPR